MDDTLSVLPGAQKFGKFLKNGDVLKWHSQMAQR